VLSHVSTYATTRGQLGFAAGQMLGRIDADDCRGLGAGPTGATEFTGLRAVVQDQNPSTPGSISLYLYGEQPGRPDFPTQPAAAAPGTTALGGVTNIVVGGGMPPAPAAWIISVGFATPLSLPSGQDLFIGLEVGPAPTWPLDGESLQFHLAVGTALAPGPGLIAQGSYLLDHVPATALLAYTITMRQGMVEPMVQAGRGRGSAVALVSVNGFESANGSFLGGLHPDAAAPPLNAGRADDLGYVVFDAVVTDLVVYAGDISGTFSANPLPLGSVVPGGQGLFCLAGSAIVLGFRLGSGTGQDRFDFRLSPAARTLVRGIDFTSQAVVIDALGVPTGTPCMRQRL
jgi:hypothetical protein